MPGASTAALAGRGAGRDSPWAPPMDALRAAVGKAGGAAKRVSSASAASFFGVRVFSFFARFFASFPASCGGTADGPPPEEDVAPVGSASIEPRALRLDGAYVGTSFLFLFFCAHVFKGNPEKTEREGNVL